MHKHVEALAANIESLGEGKLLVVTGAGISQASGIPTFRGSDPDAIWKHDPIEMATFRFFRREPVTQWSWYLHRFEMVESAKPNPGHEALVTLEKWHVSRGGSFLLITQNIDTLHESAGTQNLIKVHGTSDRLRCTRDGCTNGAPTGSLPRTAFDLSTFRAKPTPETLPRCPDCGSLMRAHVLFFDEFYQEHADYEFDRVQREATTADLLLFVGTSFSVGVTDLLLRASRGREVPAYSLDPLGSETAGAFGVALLPARAEEVLPAICRTLNAL